MRDIKGYEGFRKIEPILKGWSGDKKYYIETYDNRHLLLRMADIAEYDRKKAEFEIITRLSALGVPMSHPVDFGICDNGQSVYSLLTWCEGEDAESVLPKLSDTEQYLLGVRSGEILRLIHTIPAPVTQEEWSYRFSRKTDNKIAAYKACGVQFDGDEHILRYLEDNRQLLSGRPQCLQQGDYHVGNMIISSVRELSIIDFNRPDFGDPWEEFNRIVWSAAVSPWFATGQLNGYFGGTPPLVFFRLLAYYIASNTISSIYWAIPFGQNEVDTMLKQTQDVLRWFDNMNNPVPTWYLGLPCIQYLDEVPYKLKAPFDLSYISRFGRVFKVFDDQDSGNICFGVDNDINRYFIKCAGAPTVNYDGTPEDAVQRLKDAAPIYRVLAHPNLVRLVDTAEVGDGFALVFDWSDGECMGRQYPKSRQKFLQLPLDKRLQIFTDILAFHLDVAAKGYVAVDFYDGSIMFDFKRKKPFSAISIFIKSARL
jgi:serine/threonine-protein kinase